MPDITEATINLFVDSLIELLITDFNRIDIDNDRYEIVDKQTGLTIKMGGSSGSTNWLIYLPTRTGGHYLLERQKDRIKRAINQRANVELVQLHEKYYGNNQGAVAFADIQKMRGESLMVEEAWQNLMTVYALNMDGDNDVS